MDRDGREEAGMIAVMGASGNVGSKVSDRLRQEQRDVRVFGRSAERLERFGRQGAEVVVGDAMEIDDLQRLFKGVESALVVLPDNVTDPNYASNRSAMSRGITQALGEQRVAHVVMASSLGADRDHGVGQVLGLHELEEMLFGLEEANVIALRAAWHMENLLGSIPMAREQRVNGSIVKGDLKFPMTACVDIAEVATRHLLRPDFTGHVVKTVLGPEDRSMNEATHALGEALGMPDLLYVEFPPEGVKAALRGIGWSEQFASLLVESQVAINEGRIVAGERTAENTTPTRLEEFLSGALAG
jgi:uncharacterized protein YbjT (DUF2867 family)